MKVEIDWKDKTAYSKNHVLYFFKGKYKDGYILAFYSHSPWGRCYDQKRGWVLIKVENRKVGIIVDEVASYSWGSTGEAREVLAKWRKEHGTPIRYYLDIFGENHKWKMWERIV